MPAYVTLDFTPTQKDKLQQSGAAVTANRAKSFGENLVKGPAEYLMVCNAFDMQVIQTSPSREPALARYHSPEFKALTTVRNASVGS